MSAEQSPQLSLDLNSIYNRVLRNTQLRTLVGNPISTEDRFLNIIFAEGAKAVRSEIEATPETQALLKVNIERVRAKTLSEGTPSIDRDDPEEILRRGVHRLEITGIADIEADLTPTSEGEHFLNGDIGSQRLKIVTHEGNARISASFHFDDTYRLWIVFSHSDRSRRGDYDSGIKPFENISGEDERIWSACLDKIV